MFTYEQYRPPYVGSISDLLRAPGEIEARRALQVGDANARAAEASGQLWGGAVQQIGQIPGQMMQQRRVQQQDELGALQISEQKRAIAVRTALSKAITDTPMVEEGGLSVYDIPAITKNLPPEFRASADEVVKHLGGINDAFRSELAAKKAVVQQGATSLLASGSDPDLALHFLDVLEKNRSWPKSDLDTFRQFITAHPDKTEQVLRQFVPVQKVENAPAGSMGRDPLTGKVIPDSGVPEDPNKGAYTVNGQRFKADGTPVGALVPPQVQPSAAQTHNMRLAGVGDVPVDYVPNKDGTGGTWMYQGKDVSGKVSVIPSAAQVTINNREKLPPGDWDKTGDEFLATIPVQWRSTVKKIARYDEDPTKVASARGGSREMVMQWVNQVNPAYDASQFSNRAPTRKAFTTGTQGQTLNALNTAIGHLDQLTGLVDQLGNGAFTPGNRVWNTVQTIFGSDKVTNFDTLKDALAGEVARTLSGGQATVSGIAEQRSLMNAYSSPQALAGYVKTLIPTLGSKLSNLDYQFHQAMGADDTFSALSPESKRILIKLGFDPAHPTITPGPLAAPLDTKKRKNPFGG